MSTLDEAAVAATSGVEFDPIEGAHHLRLSFTGAWPPVLRR